VPKPSWGPLTVTRSFPLLALLSAFGCGTGDGTRAPSAAPENPDPVGSAQGGSTAAAPGVAPPVAGAAGAGDVALGSGGGLALGGGGSDAVAAGGGSGGAPGAGEAALHFVGRVDQRDAAGPRFAWSGTGFVARFSGSDVSVTLNGGGAVEFTLLIDGVLQPKLVTNASSQTYVLASGLAPGEHLLELYRRSEASVGDSQLLSFDLGAGGQLLPPPPVARRIELIGDSISAGYGNEGTTTDCGQFSPALENHYMTYGAITARALGAELSTVAWSGKGVVYNYGDTDRVDPMPLLYARVLPRDPSSVWDFSVAPDAVVINLGTNDYSTADDPPQDVFVPAYVALLERVRQGYPDAFILTTVGNLLNGQDIPDARAAIAAAVAEFQARGGDRIAVWEMNVANTAPGCDFHPSIATHQAMAEALTAQLRSLLGL
jgi:lysophospholipase L1-like esterase